MSAGHLIGGAIGRAIGGLIGAAAALLTTVSANAELFATTILPTPKQPGAAVQPYVRVPAGRIALTHVRVIDGTGAAPP